MTFASAAPSLSLQFAQSLERSLECLRQLEAAMLAEALAIEMRHPDSLQQIVLDKRSLIAQLEAETLQQKQRAERAQYAFTAAGMEKFLRALDDDGQLLGLWSTLRESAARCDRLNRTNARLIERDRKRIATSLRILSGDDGTAATYTPRGRTESVSPRSHPLSQA